MLSVLQVTPELNAGGVERTTIEIAQAISRAGGLALIASAGGRLEPDLEATGGELIRLPVNSKNPITVLQNAWRMAAIVKKRGVQIIHARSRAPAWSALMAARLTGAPFVTTFHGIYNARSRPETLLQFGHGAGATSSSPIRNTHASIILAHYRVDPARVIAIPRGADLEQFNPRKRQCSRSRGYAHALECRREGRALRGDCAGASDALERSARSDRSGAHDRGTAARRA